MTNAKKEALPTGKLTVGIVIAVLNPSAVLVSSFAPALVGVMLAILQVGPVSPPLAAALVLIAVLMNSAVDLFNDYFDLQNGNDAPENITSGRDAPLVYNEIENIKPILYLGFGLLGLAGLLGVYVIWQCGPLPAVIGAIGAVVVLTYSCGPLPLSHLPIGEPLSGFTLGGLVPLGIYAALVGRIDPIVLYQTIPMMLIVSHIMLVNNTCDIERDKKVGRRTLPILIGRRPSHILGLVFFVAWLLQMLHVVAVWFPKGIWSMIPVSLLFALLFSRIYKTPRVGPNKEAALSLVALASLGVAACFPLAVLLHLLLV